MDEFSFEGVGFVDAGMGERLAAQMADGETQPVPGRPGAFDYLTGALQTGLALGTSYVSRRMDIDLQTRLSGSMPAGSAVRRTNQTLVADHADVTTRAVASAGSIRVGDMLPWLAAAGIAWFVFRPGR